MLRPTPDSRSPVCLVQRTIGCQPPLPVQRYWRDVSSMIDIRHRTSARRSPRLRDFEYDTPGAYFVTACTFKRQPILAKITEAGAVNLTDAGRIVRESWMSLPVRFDGLTLDTFVVMPDHMHGILWITGGDDVNAKSNRPAQNLTDVMSAFKSISARGSNEVLRRVGGQVWQRSFYDRVIRTERDLSAAREYIVNNPLVFSLKIHG